MAAQIYRHRPFRSSGPPTIGTLVQMASALRDRVWRTRGTRVVVGDVKLLAGACSTRSEGAATLTVVRLLAGACSTRSEGAATLTVVRLLAGACSTRSEGAATLTVDVPAWETLVSDLLTLLGTDCVHLLIAENATASQWSDSSSYANHVTQETGSYQPTPSPDGMCVNNRAYVGFTRAESEHYRLASGFAGLAASSDALACFVVFSISDASTTRTIVDYSDSSGDTGKVIRARVMTSNIVRCQAYVDGDSTVRECSSTATVDNDISNPYLYSGWMDDADGLLHVALDSAGGGTYDVPDASGMVRTEYECTQVNLGHRMGLPSGNAFGGRMMAIVVCKGGTAARRDAVVALLESYYGEDWPPRFATPA